MPNDSKRPFEDRVRNLFANHFGDDFPTLKEVQGAYEFLRGKYTDLRDDANREVLGQVREGTVVVLKQENGNRRLPGGTVGTVVRLGIKNVTVDFGNYLKWRVPAGWLEIAPKGTKPEKTRDDYLPPPPRMRRRPVYQETPPEFA
jgi:hypothetical protein